ncbi:Hsp70 family protein [Fontivita pretiosa]|uniref:Hsp70 family protein n=1 Tax=Fontivita pretiosa TaxID=2989684 RepID=UPI003D16F594
MAFGIDFGTTNSAVVYNRNTCLYTNEGNPFPSIVALHKVTGDCICGPEAKRRKQELQDDGYLVVTSVKTQLDDPAPLGTIQGRLCSAQDIATELFKALKEHVRSQSARTGGAELVRAAVSIPVGFPPERRRVLRTCAERAGIEITDFVSEPTAAFIYCRRQMPECSRVAVFDWGGGTLDVSVLQIRDNEIHELVTEGLQEAGDRIDLRLAEWAHAQIMNGRVAAPPFDAIPPSEQWKLRWECERAKTQLSHTSSTHILLPRYLDATNVAHPIDRATLNELVAPFIDRAVETLDKALSRAAMRSGRGDVDRVLLIGGSSKLSALGERLRQIFKNRVYCPEQPDWVVAQGASYLAEHPGSYKLTQDLSLELCDGSEFKLARRGDRFNDQWRRHHLGIVEESESAQIVFAEPLTADPIAIDTSPKLRRLDNISVPMQGFYRERLRLDSRLTRDLMFEVRAQSANADEHNAAHWIYWSYAQPRCAYSIAAESSR